MIGARSSIHPLWAFVIVTRTMMKWKKAPWSTTVIQMRTFSTCCFYSAPGNSLQGLCRLPLIQERVRSGVVYLSNQTLM